MGGSWFSANDKWALTDAEILKAVACMHPRYCLGTRAARASRYAVLDIDWDSRYHNKESFDLIVETLREAGIAKCVPFRSSYSDGWHLYIFFEETISSKDLQNQLTALLKNKGFVISKGTLEIFPNPGATTDGQGLRIPLQTGFAWLDPTNMEVEIDRDELSPTKALTYFMDELENSANSKHDFHQLKAHVERLKNSQHQSLPNNELTISNNVVPFRRTNDESPEPDDADLIRSVFGTLLPGINPTSWLTGASMPLVV